MRNSEVYDELSDRQLIARFTRNSDEHAFAALVSRHGPMVQRVCRRIVNNVQDAEDVFQAVFLLLARKSRHVRWHSSVGNWLYGVAIRIARQEHRRMSKHREQRLIDPAEIVDGSDRKIDELESIESERELYLDLNELPNKYRAPLVLCYLEGKTRQQAAEDLGLKESTVKGRLERGKKMLAAKLAKRGVAIPAALLSGQLAASIAEAAISKSLALSTAQAATSFVAASAATAASSAAATIAKGELGKMLLAAQIKWAVITVSSVAVFGSGAVVVSQHASGGNGQSSDTAQVADSVDGMLLAKVDTKPKDETPKDEGTKDDTPKKDDKNQPETIEPRPIVHSFGQLAIAMHNFHDVNGSFPAAASYDANQRKLLSWRVHLLPYLDQEAEKLYREFRLKEPWNSAHNKKLIKKMPKIYATRSDSLQKSGKTVIVVPVGKDTAFANRNRVRISDIADGTSNTIMFLALKPQHAVEWTKPDDWELDEKDPFKNLMGEHGEGLCMCTCDGARRTHPKPLDVKTLKALMTRSGGEIISF